MGSWMNGKVKSYIAILMGIIIAVADLIWLAQSTYVPFWVALGIIIFLADVIWLYIDYSFMAVAKKK